MYNEKQNQVTGPYFITVQNYLWGFIPTTLERYIVIAPLPLDVIIRTFETVPLPWWSNAQVLVVQPFSNDLAWAYVDINPEDKDELVFKSHNIVTGHFQTAWFKTIVWK